jgi:hypothetical protein
LPDLGIKSASSASRRFDSVRANGTIAVAILKDGDGRTLVKVVHVVDYALEARLQKARLY